MQIGVLLIKHCLSAGHRWEGCIILLKWEQGLISFSQQLGFECEWFYRIKIKKTFNILQDIEGFMMKRLKSSVRNLLTFVGVIHELPLQMLEIISHYFICLIHNSVTNGKIKMALC